jgi:antitoxin component of MazEF toxin-antitoxin module
MRKEIKSYGNTNVIVLTKSDLKLYELNIGDVVEITITRLSSSTSEPHNKKKLNTTHKREETK